MILMAKSTYDGLPPDEQKMFHEAAAVAARAMREKVAAVEANGVAELQAAGMQVVTDVDRAKFQEALEPAYAEYSKKFGKDKIDQIRNYKP
jgi:TRAP-type C4-dicarboxylate transport system substrate-binding protein